MQWLAPLAVSDNEHTRTDKNISGKVWSLWNSLLFCHQTLSSHCSLSFIRITNTHTRNQSVGVIAEGINFQERRKDYGSRGRSNTHLNSTYRCVLNADFDAVPNIKLRHLIAPLQRSSSSLARSYSCCRNKKPLHSFLSYELEHNLRSSDSFIRLPGGNCLSIQFTGIQLLKQTSRVSLSRVVEGRN